MLVDIGLPRVSNFIWCLARQQRETSCCTVNISPFQSTLSSFYPSHCDFFSSIQVLGSWEGSPGIVSPNTGKGIGEGFVLCAPSPWPSVYFHVSILPSEKVKGDCRGTEPCQTQGHGKGFYLERVEYSQIKKWAWVNSKDSKIWNNGFYCQNLVQEHFCDVTIIITITNIIIIISSSSSSSSIANMSKVTWGIFRSTSSSLLISRI